ncbi:MAG TPA: hypothetical protein VNK43_01400 [Gemmatimonadales bacterium]|nr:hypothetical protein [Gemmatimonadales bacterium]
MSLRRAAGACGLAALVACGHSEPLQPERHAPDTPRFPGLPRRLTLNRGDDGSPAWLADAGAILYTADWGDHPDRDRCLVELPPDGGAARRTICHRAPGGDDSTDVYASAAASPDGRLAFLHVTSRPTDRAPVGASLRLATVADPAASTELLGLPRILPSGRPHSHLSQLQWLGTDALVYLAERFVYLGPPAGPDTLLLGIEVAHLSLGGGSPVLASVPGTTSATSVGAGETPGVIYYTLMGDSRIYRRVLSSGEVTVAHDFGGRIARDVRRVGSRLLAVVGGKVAVVADPALGAYQRDEGGGLVLVDPATGHETPLSAGQILFRRPAPAPAGARLVVEGFPYTLLEIRDGNGQVIGLDTLVATRGDLWLYEAQ